MVIGLALYAVDLHSISSLACYSPNQHGMIHEYRTRTKPLVLLLADQKYTKSNMNDNNDIPSYTIKNDISQSPDNQYCDTVD